MAIINLFLVDPNQLFRDGLKRLLEERDCVVAGQASSLAAAADALAAAGPVDILVFDVATEEDCGAVLERIRFARPAAKAVVLTADSGRDVLVRAIGWSVDSYLTKDMSAEALVRSFELVMLGQQIFPTKLMMTAMNDQAPAAAEPRGQGGLSPRELQILRALVSGHSNKMIARELNISEATVKVHLKALLRKVRVNNRTQAAVWALNQGVSGKVAVSA
jgi:two-component system nitrate/nitrite response regulator NarL